MDREAVEEFFAPFGRVAVRRMFSGHGVYIEDACFALVLRGAVWLKADASTKARFSAAGSVPFTYETKTRAVAVEAFWSLPEFALDEEDELRRWCALALEAARKTAATKAAARARAVARPAKRAAAAGRRAR